MVAASASEGHSQRSAAWKKGFHLHLEKETPPFLMLAP